MPGVVRPIDPPRSVRLRAIAALLLGAAVTWAAPLVGLVAAGKPLEAYLHFPPRTEYVAHTPFAWSAFVVMSLPAVGVLAVYLAALAHAEPRAAAPASSSFPWWGWLGAGLVTVSWLLAWSDGPVPAGWRRHVFTPLWLGYVLVMNGLAFRRTRRSLLTHRTAWFLALFPVSAGFWWLFEHLNQFVDNWYYSGIEASGDWDYFLQATVPFSTVLPAVASTWAWLKQFPRLDALALPAVRGHRSLAWLALVAGAVALAGIGIWPEALYAALWFGPLLVLCGLQRLLAGETLFAPLRRGDWRPILQPALAALICGFFWELWNYGAAAKWHYSIPLVERFHVFEMPALGYAGYLLFGIICALVLDLVGGGAGRESGLTAELP